MNRPATLPLLSLKIGLRAYFSTYRQISTNFFLSFSVPEEYVPEEYEGNGHEIAYYTSCFETIIHFQHFAELVCKEFLRKEHPLLALDSAQNTSIFYKLLNRTEISLDEQDNLKSVEFSKSLERICTLAEITTSTENKVRYSLFSKWRKPLEQLNILRNRLWHRGTFFLKFSALDQFVGGYILPFVNEIVALSEYNNSDFIWKYQPLDCGIDPLTEIAQKLSGNSQYDKHEIAYLKELGRAAYHNPLWIGSLFDGDPIVEQRNEHTRKNIESDALIAFKNRKANRLTKCPVCGMNSLINTEAYVNCAGCGLHIGAELATLKLRNHEFANNWFQ